VGGEEEEEEGMGEGRGEGRGEERGVTSIANRYVALFGGEANSTREWYGSRGGDELEHVSWKSKRAIIGMQG